MKKLRIGVLGCANIALRHVIPSIMTLKNEFELVCIASRTEEKANYFAGLFMIEPIVGYQNLLDRTDLDVVYIPLPTGIHEKWITKCLESGKHVISEKSLAINFDTAKELIDLAKMKNLVLIENFMFRYHLQHKIVWDKISNNELGAIRLFRSQFGFPPLDKSNFRYCEILGGGALLDAGAYTINASLWFLGNEQDVLSSTLHFDSDLNVDIYGSATLINNKGVISQLSFGFDNFYQCNYEFWGTTSKLVLPKAFTPKPEESVTVIFEKQESRIEYKVRPCNHFLRLLLDFHQKVLLESNNIDYSGILAQSRILTEIRKKAIKINL